MFFGVLLVVNSAMAFAVWSVEGLFENTMGVIPNSVTNQRAKDERPLVTWGQSRSLHYIWACSSVGERTGRSFRWSRRTKGLGEDAASAAAAAAAAAAAVAAAAAAQRGGGGGGAGGVAVAVALASFGIARQQ